MSEKRVLLTGLCISHVVGSKIELLRSMGYSPHALDIGAYDQAEALYKPDSFRTYLDLANVTTPSFLRRWAWRFKEMGRNTPFVKEEKDKADLARRTLAEVQPDIIWGVWGLSALRWLRTFRRVGFKGKTVWTANVLPNRLDDSKVFRWSVESAIYRKWLPRTDGVILSERRMLEFLHSHWPVTRDSKCLMLPDYLPASWHANPPAEPVARDRPHVVYLGAPERHVKQIDRVDPLLRELAEAGICVHCSRPKESAIEHELVQFYDRFDDSSFLSGEFARFISQYDAILVMYAPRGDFPRFASTYPTRFVMALCACIPMFVRKGLLFACEDFVESHGIGKAYDTPGELKEMLSDRDLMASLRATAAKNAERFGADVGENKALLQEFFNSL